MNEEGFLAVVCIRRIRGRHAGDQRADDLHFGAVDDERTVWVDERLAAGTRAATRPSRRHH